MEITIVGVKDIDYTNKNGVHICGQSVFFQYEDNNTLGFCTDHAFLGFNKRLVPVPKLPALAQLYYNKYGKVDSIIVEK